MFFAVFTKNVVCIAALCLPLSSDVQGVSTVWLRVCASALPVCIDGRGECSLCRTWQVFASDMAQKNRAGRKVRHGISSDIVSS